MAQSVFRAPMRSSRPRDADPWMRKHAPAKLARPESTGFQSSSRPERPHRPGNTRRMRRTSSRACADAPATPPQRAAPRPVRKTRAGARRTSGPERLPGADANLATSRHARGCANTPPPSWAVRNRREFSPHLDRNARIDRETPDACTGLRAVCVPTRQRHLLRTRRPAQSTDRARGQGERADRRPRSERFAGRAERLEAWARRSVARAERARERVALLSASRSASRSAGDSPASPGSDNRPPHLYQIRGTERRAEQISTGILS